MIPISKWVWYGRPGHFICAHRCMYRLTTLVGDYIVSSVGDMADGEPVGHQRTHETMVFKAGACCDCGCGELRIESGQEIEMLPANSDGECHANHMALCRKYAAMGVEVGACQ